MDTFGRLSPVWTHLTDFIIDHAEGIYLYDGNGNRYMDFTSGIGVANTGHCHPNVVKAVQEQAGKILFSQINCATVAPAVELAEELNKVTPDSIDCFFFSNSGAEAVEGTVKLARAATKRPHVIVFNGSFHGRTSLTMAMSGSKTIYRAGFQPLPSGVFYAPFPYAYQLGWSEDEAVDFATRELKFLLKTQTAPDETALIIVEPVLGEGGYVPTPARFLQELRAICDQYGILLAFDEIQCGCGRTGDFWAFTASGVVPDILIMAKGLASGMPMSAIGSRRELMEHWVPGSHGGTYGGGNATVLAGAVATVKTLQEEGLIENARKMGDYLLESLKDLQQEFPIIGDVRGRGLMVATEFTVNGKPGTEVCSAVQKACLKEKLMLLNCGSYNQVIRWIPPLIVTQQQLDDALGIYRRALESAS